MNSGTTGNPESGAKKPRSNLQLRVISALVLAAIVLVLAWWGGAAFRIFAALMGAAVFHEWSTLAKGRYSPIYRVSAWLLAAAVLIALAVGADALTLFGAVAIAAAGAWVASVALGQGGGLAFGILYAVAPAVALAFLRGDDAAGLWALLFLFACVWGTDIAAYFAGRRFGGPKLAPSISPSKTWSGAVGGAVAAALGGGAIAVLGPSSVSIVVAMLVALGVSAISQFGDLFESAYKRRHGAKDSGRIIPGHGGVMDRVDGLVAAALALYVVCALLAGPDRPAFGLFGG
jgi:phosphatidate cytidylyltransferase